jgi:hypothetical protein
MKAIRVHEFGGRRDLWYELRVTVTKECAEGSNSVSATRTGLQWFPSGRRIVYLQVYNGDNSLKRQGAASFLKVQLFD